MLEWDMAGKSLKQRLSELPLPPPEASAIATSGTTVEVVDRRLRELHGRTDPAALAEVDFLLGVRSRLVAASAKNDAPGAVALP